MEVSNLQELKDAAIELMKYTCNSCEQRYCEEDVEEENGRSIPSPCSAIIRMRNALSVNPIRQCDVGTAEEQTERIRELCTKFKPSCIGCPCYGDIHRVNCWLTWAQMPYEENEGGMK